MTRPFTVVDFFLVFRDDNAAIWPAQITAMALGLVPLTALFVGRHGTPIVAGLAVARQSRIAQQVGGFADRLTDLRTVQQVRAIHAPITNQDEVVTVNQPLQVLEMHVGRPGPALEEENGSGGIIAQSAGANYRQSNQPRVRIARVLWHNERAAIGRIFNAASLILTGL
jgi:hypothetical protein